jgi:Succinate dehydrogenase/fumarate reductase, flavoprotein subunit
MAEFIKTADYSDISPSVAEKTKEIINRIINSNGTEKVFSIRTRLQEIMMDKCGIFRNENDLKNLLAEIKELKERYKNISIQDKGTVFNTELMEAIELENLIINAEVTAYSALNRTESRGAHSREDFPNRDDNNWLKHTFIYENEGREPVIRYKPVTITKYQPMERKY